jgi:hypothetical protein
LSRLLLLLLDCDWREMVVVLLLLSLWSELLVLEGRMLLVCRLRIVVSRPMHLEWLVQRAAEELAGDWLELAAQENRLLALVSLVFEHAAVVWVDFEVGWVALEVLENRRVPAVSGLVALV